MTTTNWIFANVCYFILFIVDFPAYVVDNWTCEDTSVLIQTLTSLQFIASSTFLGSNLE